MGPIDAVWHLLNFFAPALGLGLIAASLVKLAWWRSLREHPWWSLAVAAVLASMVPLVAGLVLLGRDGKMATYAAMVACCAVALWWRALR